MARAVIRDIYGRNLAARYASAKRAYHEAGDQLFRAHHHGQSARALSRSKKRRSKSRRSR